MTALYFDCPHCTTRLSSQEDSVGQAVLCPICNGIVLVPSLPLIAPLSAEKDESMAALAALFALIGPSITLSFGGMLAFGHFGTAARWIAGGIGLVVGVVISWRYGETITTLAYWLFGMFMLVMLIALFVRWLVGLFL